MITLGGQNARTVRNYGDICMSLQYVNNEPAMVLFPTRKQSGAAACVICLSALHKYADDHYLARQAAEFAKFMLIDQNKSTIFKICRIVNDNIDALCQMKPEPMKDVVDGIAKVRIGDKLFETEVKSQIPKYGE